MRMFETIINGYSKRVQIANQNNLLLPSVVWYYLVPFKRHCCFIGHRSFNWPFTFLRLWGLSIYWINTSSKKAVFYKTCAAWNQVWVILTSLLEACSLIWEVCLLSQATFGVIHVLKLDCVQTKISTMSCIWSYTLTFQIEDTAGKN